MAKKNSVPGRIAPEMYDEIEKIKKKYGVTKTEAQRIILKGYNKSKRKNETEYIDFGF